MSIFHHVRVAAANTGRCQLATFLAGLLAVIGVGCGPASSTPQSATSPTSATSPATSGVPATSGASDAAKPTVGLTSTAASVAPAGGSPLIAKPTSDSTSSSQSREIWEISRIEGRKVGHARTRIEQTVDAQGEPLERIEMEQSVALARFGQQLRQSLRLVSWERPTGGLVRFESQVSSGGEWTLTRGHVDGDSLSIESATPGKTERQTFPWSDQLGGFYAVERLLSKPWSPGERRSVRALVPLLNQIGKTDLQDAGMEALRIEGQSRSLRKIRRVDTVGAIKLESTHWVDETGDTVRSISTFPPPGMETVRTDRATAVANDPADAPFDLGAATRIAVSNMPPDPHGTREIVYVAELSGGPIESVFPSGSSQSVRKLDERHVEIRVRAVRPSESSTSAAEDIKRQDLNRPPVADAPTDEERRSNGLIQSDDPAVVALAKSVSADETDPWRLAVALEAAVRRHVQPQHFSQAMATAAEVARSGEGDCTEHAVLLAAMCRARGLPARVAIGLVYAESLGGFAYHMWNEVWIDGQWIPLDATLARQGIGAGHLKLASSSLQGADAFAALLPVVNVLGRLKLSVTSP